MARTITPPYRFINVLLFINEFHLSMRHRTDWQEMVEEMPKVLQNGEIDGNDVYGKIILSHRYGEALTLLFKKWITRNFPCEDDLLIARKIEPNPYEK